jgi:hypothetical protein
VWKRTLCLFSFGNADGNFEWAFTNDYGPNVDSDRRVLYDELARLSSWWNGLWCIGGDFKIICFPSKRSNGFCPSITMLEFFKFIFEQDLMDIPPVGGIFAWSNNRDPLAWSRIEKFLLSLDWETHFLDVS